MEENEKVEIVYVLQNGDTNQYKIGMTNNLNNRIGQLQTGCPGKLKIIKTFHSFQRREARGLEMALHHKFEIEGKRIRMGGEWFALSQEDIDFLTQQEDDVYKTFKNILSFYPKKDKKMKSAEKTFYWWC